MQQREDSSSRLRFRGQLLPANQRDRLCLHIEQNQGVSSLQLADDRIVFLRERVLVQPVVGAFARDEVLDDCAQNLGAELAIGDDYFAGHRCSLPYLSAPAAKVALFWRCVAFRPRGAALFVLRRRLR